MRAPAAIPHYVGGSREAMIPARSGVVHDPATGEQTAQVGFATRADVDLVVGRAAAAAPGWRDTSLARRSAILFRFRELLDRRKDDVARLITAEHGKTLSDARGEVDRGLETVEFACGIAHHLRGAYSAGASTGVDVHSTHEPLGVVAGITPFNFPAMVPLWMFPNAIACGNAFVLKPSEKDPSAPVLLAELFAEAGLPAGVLNVVHGDGEAVDALVEHPGVAAISFVGSTPVARHVYETATAHGKRVQALGGAKNHMVVLPDADLEAAADAAVSAAFGSAGERCMAISIVIAVGAVADPLVEAIRTRALDIRIGGGLEEGSQMGPLITREHRDRVAGYVALGAEEGATVVLDGREQRFTNGGFFLGVSLLDHVDPAMRVYRDEIFGPVLGVVRAGSLDEAIAIVNANPYGNGVALFTRDGGAATHFQDRVDVGMVGINVPIPVPVSYYSFGGWKQSLFGDAHIYGPDGIRFYTRTKVVTARWPRPAAGQVDLDFPRTRS